MSASELLRLIIDADAQGAVKGLTQVGQAADKNLKGAQSSTDKLAGNLQKFGAVAVGVGAVAATGLFKAGEAASDLGETVSQSKQIFGDAEAGIGSFADSAAQGLGQSERAAREAANTFGLFFTNAGKSKDEAAGMSIELTKLASDMASFKNTSPEQAVEALGAALRGESEPIRAYGVMLDDATLKQRALSMGLIQTTTGTLPPAIKMQAAYAEILAQTGTIQGDFARTSGGLANQQRILAAEFENAKASIGQGALPVLTKLTSVAAAAAGGFADLDQKSGGAVGTIATIATGALLAGGGLSMVVGQAIKMRDNLSMLKGPLTNTTGGLSTLGKVTAGLGLASAVFGLVQMARASSEVTVNVEELNRRLADNSAANQKQISASVQLASQMGKLDDLVKKTAESDVIAAEKLIEHAEAAGVSADEIAKLRAITNGKRDADIEGREHQEAYTKSLNEASGATSEFGGKQETAAEKVERLQEELRDATEAIEDNYAALNKGTALAIDYEAGIDDLTQSLKDNGTTLDLSTEKGRANASQIMRTGETIAALIQRRYQETGSTKSATDAGLLYVENLRNQLRQAGFTEDAIATLITQMHLTPDEIRTNILADTAAAQQALTDYQRQINQLPRTVTTLFNGVTVNRPNRMDGNATGTSYWKGGPTWVGERGPEIVDLPRGSAVYDHHTSMAMASAGGGGGTQVIQLVVDGNVLAEVVANAERSRARGRGQM